MNINGTHVIVGDEPLVVLQKVSVKGNKHEKLFSSSSPFFRFLFVTNYWMYIKCSPVINVRAQSPFQSDFGGLNSIFNDPFDKS